MKYIETCPPNYSQPQGIRIFDRCFHTDYEICLPIILLSTSMENGEGAQNITPQNRFLHSSKIVSLSDSVGFFLTREVFHKLNSRFKRFPLIELSRIKWGFKISRLQSTLGIKIFIKLNLEEKSLFLSMLKYQPCKRSRHITTLSPP